MTKASFQAFCRAYTGTTLEAMADAHALCDLQNAARGDIAARLGAISGLPPAVAVQVAWNGTDTDLNTYFNAGVAILRALGSAAHTWLPGANGVSVASLPSNNYLLSNGSTGYSGVDAVDGLTLDALNGGASTQTARFTGAEGEYFYTPKGANTLLAGDIELICQAALTNWQAPAQTFVSSDNLVGNYGFVFFVDGSGFPAFRYSPDGTALRTATASAKCSTVFSANATGYVRVTYNSTTGDTKFYTSPDGTTWTQLGTTQVITAGTVFSGTGGIAVGAQFSGTTTAIAGSIKRLWVYRDLVGTIAVDFNPASYVLGSTSWVSAVGETWTFGSSTASTILPSGSHLTQATTANKPLVRRGSYNLLTYSNFASGWGVVGGTLTANAAAAPDGTTTAASWVSSGTSGTHRINTPNVSVTSGGVYTTSVTLKAGLTRYVQLTYGGGTFPGTAYVNFDLQSGVVSASGGSPVASGITSLGNGFYTCWITDTAAATAANGTCLLYALITGSETRNPTTTGNGTYTLYAPQIEAGRVPGDYTPTTATAASNPSAGKYWWSFDGSNGSLLSGNLAITNAVTIVIAGRVNAMPSVVYVVAGEDANGVQVTIYADGSFSLDKSTVSTIVRSAAGLIVAGVPFVITARLSGGTAVVRLDGVQKATAATALTYSATTGMQIGRKFDSLFPLNGALGWVVPIAAALSDADCLTVERLVGQQFPGAPVF